MFPRRSLLQSQYCRQQHADVQCDQVESDWCGGVLDVQSLAVMMIVSVAMMFNALPYYYVVTELMKSGGVHVLICHFYGNSTETATSLVRMHREDSISNGILVSFPLTIKPVTNRTSSDTDSIQHWYLLLLQTQCFSRQCTHYLEDSRHHYKP